MNNFKYKVRQFMQGRYGIDELGKALFAAGMILYVIGMIRMGEQVELSNIWDVGFDLIINNRNLYVLMDYANTHGYTWGESMLMSFLSIIPFLFIS